MVYDYLLNVQKEGNEVVLVLSENTGEEIGAVVVQPGPSPELKPLRRLSDAEIDVIQDCLYEIKWNVPGGICTFVILKPSLDDAYTRAMQDKSADHRVRVRVFKSLY